MKKFAFGIAALAIAAGSAVAQTEVAYWAFNNLGLPNGGFGYQPGDFPLSADFGAQAGSASISVLGGITGETNVNGNGDTVFTWIQSFVGSTVNAQFAEVAGGSLSVQGGTDTANNGASIVVDFDGGLWTDLNFSFAGRRTSSGFSNVDILAFDNGVQVGTLASGLNLTTSGTLELISLNAGVLDGVTNASIAFVLNGATGSSGNVRLDNFFIEGNFIPTPGAVALFAAAGLAATRRRRA